MRKWRFYVEFAAFLLTSILFYFYFHFIMCRQGRIKDFDFVGQSFAQERGAVESTWGGVWGGCSPPIRKESGECPSSHFFIYTCSLEMRILVHSPAYLNVCIRTVICPDTEYRPPVRLRSQTVQSDCGLIKGAGVLAEEGTERYLRAGGKYVTNLITANVETLSHDDCNYYSFSSDGHEFGRRVP